MDDGIAVIRQSLRDRGLSDVGISRILRIDNKLVSVDFTLSDQKLLIKYWNPEQIELLNARANLKQRALEKYRKDWESFAEEYERSGGKIYCVEASSREDIMVALESCSELNPGKNPVVPQTLYAKE
jgi:hypothetical protein